MALLSVAQITSQVRNAIANNAAVSSFFPSQRKVIIADKKDEKKKAVLQEKPEIVVYPRRIKAIEKIIVTLADTTTQQLTGGISALDMPVTPHYVAPRAPIVLCHGLYGFDKIGPDALPLLQVQYWGGIENALAKLGAKVIVTKVPSTGSILERAQTLHAILKSILDGKEVNFIAHSMGGLDCRYLISHIPDRPYKVNSLTTISTPHRGSPVMDWFRDNVGVGMAGSILANAANNKLLRDPSFMEPSSYAADKFNQQHHKWSLLAELAKNSPKFDPVVKKMISLVDTAAYANLTTDYCTNSFNPNTLNDPNVSYYSYGASATFPRWSLLNMPYKWTKEKEGENDGLVSVKSAQWGKYIKTLDADHWDLNGQR
ncbi:Alpha/Beta hydrolase protein [Mucor mucedo]|uniref:Alpha/Beta hydrolase protein n=1 Tax=Mucor mucedo TaxID=29922 RepID=UPI00221EA06D|nr:Alpha/Beta hydrolase protein [Mucor mucedo]KAI7888921.1 Alpha/Beta hydrolase protein [Mucor mucedo]